MGRAFDLKEAFFKKISIERPPNIPEGLHIQVLVETLIADNPNHPDWIEVQTKINTPEDSVIEMEIIQVSQFEPVGGKDDLTLREQLEFLEQRGLHMIFLSIRQLVISMTSQMGMKTIKLNVPSEYKLDSEPEEQT